jgi:hypothetical protein
MSLKIQPKIICQKNVLLYKWLISHVVWGVPTKYYYRWNSRRSWNKIVFTQKIDDCICMERYVSLMKRGFTSVLSFTFSAGRYNAYGDFHVLGVHKFARIKMNYTKSRLSRIRYTIHDLIAIIEKKEKKKGFYCKLTMIKNTAIMHSSLC